MGPPLTTNASLCCMRPLRRDLNHQNSKWTLLAFPTTRRCTCLDKYTNEGQPQMGTNADSKRPRHEVKEIETHVERDVPSSIRKMLSHLRGLLFEMPSLTFNSTPPSPQHQTSGLHSEPSSQCMPSFCIVVFELACLYELMRYDVLNHQAKEDRRQLLDRGHARGKRKQRRASTFITQSV